MASGSTGATILIGTSCTHYAGAEVTITVPSSGNVVVHAGVWALINHVAGTRDAWLFVLGTSATDCSSVPFQWRDELSAGTGSEYVDRSGFVQNVFPVTAGTYTFYLNGIMSSGQDANDVFWYANLVAVFYPA